MPRKGQDRIRLIGPPRIFCRPSPVSLGCEERAQECGCLILHHARIYLRLPMRLGVIKDTWPLRHAARFRIRSRIIKTRQARCGNGPCTGRARLKTDPNIAARKAFLPQCGTSGTNGEHLGMGGRVMARAHLVAGFGDHNTILDDHGTNRHLTLQGGLSRQIKRAGHMAVKFVHIPFMPQFLPLSKQKPNP